MAFTDRRLGFTLVELPVVSPSAALRTSKGFTLVELLVVVAIIVVLLAMLSPALSKSIYQAQLALCGTNLKATAQAVTTYAFDSRRSYPYRKIVHEYNGVEVDPMRLTIPSDTVTGLYDDRITLRGYVPINKVLQDPLTQQIDMEGSSVSDTYVYSTYAMWWSWGYRPIANAGAPQKASRRIGDGFEWTQPGTNATSYYYALVSDINHRHLSGWGIAGHPDSLFRSNQFRFQDEQNPWAHQLARATGTSGSKATLSWWSNDPSRGLIDVNNAMQDGSIRRTGNLKFGADEQHGLRPIPAFVDDPDKSGGKDRHFFVPEN